MSTKKRDPYNVDPAILLQDTDYLNIIQAMHWIKEEYNLDVTRQTVYRWIRTGLWGARWRGKHKRKLFAIRLCGQIITKKQYISTFATEIMLCSHKRSRTRS